MNAQHYPFPRYVAGFAATGSGGAAAVCFSDDALRKPSWVGWAARAREQEDAPKYSAKRRAYSTHEQIEGDMRNFI